MTVTKVPRGPDRGYDFYASSSGSGSDLLSISSSGNSENIVRAVQWAKDNGLRTIAMTGFSGGRSAGLADANLHVASDNYGVVEDLHQSIMHVLAQFLRMQHLPEGTPFKGCF